MPTKPIFCLAFLLAASAAGCTTENELFCNSETPCDPASDRPYCDFAGDFGPSNTCIPFPVDAGVGPDADPLAPDAGGAPAFCESELAPDCDDGIACTDDVCDDASEGCAHLSNHDHCGGPTPFCHPTLGCVAQTCSDVSECDDGTFCNGEEECDIPEGESVGTCRPGTAPTCDDSIGCTVDSCNVASDSCANVPDHGECSDGKFCNGAETCSATLGCQSGTAPVLSDGVDCTVDACDEGADAVTHTPDNGECNDGKFCNGSEVCSATLGCLAGAAPIIDDGVDCTDDSCDEATDTIQHVVDHASCSDGKFCNGVEFCSATLDCQSGTPPTVDDGVGCTADSCDEAADVVKHIADDSVCDDGKFCNGAEVCHPVMDCQSGTPPTLSDGVGCTIDSCDEVNDEIDHIADDTLCIDALYCNGTESCSATLDCQAGAPVSCPKNPACHLANSCSEAMDDCNPTMREVGFSWSLAGKGSGSGLSQQCGEGTVVYTSPSACGSGSGFDYVCSLDPDGELYAYATSSDGDFFCLGPAGPKVTSGCSSIVVIEPSTSTGAEFRCCFE